MLQVMDKVNIHRIQLYWHYYSVVEYVFFLPNIQSCFTKVMYRFSQSYTRYVLRIDNCDERLVH